MPLLIPPKSPNLPLAPAAYERQYMDQVNNALRLYFNRLDVVNSATLKQAGGSSFSFPYAAIQRTTNKTFTANTATQITLDQNDFLNNCTNDGTDGIHVGIAGLYNYQFSTQFRNTDTSIHSAWIWLRVNSADVAGTGSKFDVISSHGGIDGYIIGAANFYVKLNAGDYVEMWAAVSNTAVSFDAIPAQVSPFVAPASPSVVATLSFVSALPT